MEKSLVPQARDPYQIMDRMDDSLIEAELENRIVKTWVYSFTGSDGKFQSGLSKVGVDACCTEMAKTGHIIREGEVKFQIDPTNDEYILFQGIATRYAISKEGKEIMMEAVNGTKRQWTMMKKRDGKVVNDPFWYEKGAMKALRNARARMIPEEIRTKIITLAKQKGRIKDINSNDKPPKSTGRGQTSTSVRDNEKGEGMPAPKMDKLTKAFVVAIEEWKKDIGETNVMECLGTYGVTTPEEILVEDRGKVFAELAKFKKRMDNQEDTAKD